MEDRTEAKEIKEEASPKTENTKEEGSDAGAVESAVEEEVTKHLQASADKPVPAPPSDATSSRRRLLDIANRGRAKKSHGPKGATAALQPSAADTHHKSDAMHALGTRVSDDGGQVEGVPVQGEGEIGEAGGGAGGAGGGGGGGGAGGGGGGTEGSEKTTMSMSGPEVVRVFPHLSVELESTTECMGQYLGYDGPGGVYVRAVDQKGIFRDAGVKQGDLLVSFAGHELDRFGETLDNGIRKNIYDLAERIPFGAPIELVLWRDGKEEVRNPLFQVGVGLFCPFNGVLWLFTVGTLSCYAQEHPFSARACQARLCRSLDLRASPARACI